MAPFKSEAQRKYLYSKHPKVAEKFAQESAGKRLPQYVSGSKHEPKNMLLRGMRGKKS